jgi:hypothetical protein
MKKIIKCFRILIAEIFLTIGHKIDCRDIEDFKLELKRLKEVVNK